MIRNFLLIAIRNLRKQKFYAFINIAGLAVGIACCLLIVLYVQHELSYDRHHEHADRIYRMGADITFGDLDGKIAYLPAPMAPTLMRDFPEVESAARFREQGSRLVKRGDNENIKEEKVIYADPQIFDIFSIKLVEGEKDQVLVEPKTIVINQSIAKKYFGEENPMGQTLTISNKHDYKVTGVVEDFPNNSHMQFALFLPMTELEDSRSQIWVSHNYPTYVLLREGTDPVAFENKVRKLVAKYAGPQLQQFLGVTMEELEQSGKKLGYFIMPLVDIYLYSEVTMGDFGRSGDIAYVYIFSAIALFILLIACINFMNLSTARSAQRAREVGVRKVLGSFRGQLIAQFLIESVLMSVIAFLFAVLLAELMMPIFNEMSGKTLSIPLVDGKFLPMMLGASILVGILAGVYPAFFLSAFKPVEVMKGKLSTGAGSKWLRSSLVVFQFWVSIMLMVGTLVVYQQMQFVQTKNLGFNKDQVLVLQDTWVLGREKVQTFKQEILKSPDIISGSVSGYLPVISSRNNNLFWPGHDLSQDASIIMENWRVDHDYVSTMGMELLEGRDFSLDFPTDSQGVILNEAAVLQLGLGEDPVGLEVVTIDDIDEETGEKTYIRHKVIGVVKNFHFESLKQTVAAVGLFIGSANWITSFRFETKDVKGTLGFIESKWKEFAPGQPFNYSFLDDRFDEVYRTEERQGKIFGSFAVLAILVACLGLFALAAFTAERRNKEIGIRKVMGANVRQIMLLLSTDYIRYIFIAMVLAVPAAWWTMTQWLNDFEYRIELGAGVFLSAGFIALTIALLTVSYQSLRAALANPVDAIKDE